MAKSVSQPKTKSLTTKMENPMYGNVNVITPGQARELGMKPDQLRECALWHRSQARRDETRKKHHEETSAHLFDVADSLESNMKKGQ